MNRNDKAWKDFFEANDSIASDLKKNKYVYITASALKKFREPRLMAKIDTIELLPTIFKKNHLSILPVKNGEYIIFKDPLKLSFFSFPENFEQVNKQYHQPAIDLETFDSFEKLESLYEAQALDVALMSSIIKDFTNEEKLWLTIRGRHFTRDFIVHIPSINQEINISKVQIEIDAGYESESKIYLFEAKIGERENFNIRQLLFPYLEWKKRTAKPVVPIFFYFTNGLYYLFQFDLGHSLGTTTIVKQACYSLSRPKKIDLFSIIKNSTLDNSLVTGIPFPQANDLNKVIDTVSLVNQGYETKEDISEVLEFDERQGDYYGNAARYIGLLDRKDNQFFITDDGKKLLQLNSPSLRAEFIIQHLVKRPVFHQVFNRLLQLELNLEHLDHIDISQIIENQTVLSSSTPQRRASTVRQWVKWGLGYA